MKASLVSMFLLSILAATATAFDAPPPVTPKTLQATIGLCSESSGSLETTDTPISSLLNLLQHDIARKGHKVVIDTSEVEERLSKTITIKIDETTFLETVAIVADMIDSSVHITPGSIKLVPQTSDESSGEQDAAGQPATPQ